MFEEIEQINCSFPIQDSYSFLTSILSYDSIREMQAVRNIKRSISLCGGKPKLNSAGQMVDTLDEIFSKTHLFGETF